MQSYAANLKIQISAKSDNMQEVHEALLSKKMKIQDFQSRWRHR